jgi:hypothetical protein
VGVKAITRTASAVKNIKYGSKYTKIKIARRRKM